MICQLAGIAQPKDTDVLWKYMSLEKFVSLLDTRSLFFTRADKFEDPFEGFTPLSVTEYYKHNIDNIATFEMLQKNWHKYTLCSCWHNAPEESMAMWEKYHMHNSGIAIKTTFGDFKGCLRNEYDIFLGKIEYINHYEYQVPQNLNEMSMLYTWYFHKRKPFEYEREFRAIIGNLPSFLRNHIDNLGNLKNQDTTLEKIEFPDTCEIGLPFNVDVNLMIGEVITSPYSEKWITDVVRSVVRQYGLDFNVNPSNILDDPSE